MQRSPWAAGLRRVRAPGVPGRKAGSFWVPGPRRRGYSLVYGCENGDSATGRDLPRVMLTGRPCSLLANLLVPLTA